MIEPCECNAGKHCQSWFLIHRQLRSRVQLVAGSVQPEDPRVSKEPGQVADLQDSIQSVDVPEDNHQRGRVANHPGLDPRTASGSTAAMQEACNSISRSQSQDSPA